MKEYLMLFRGGDSNMEAMSPEHKQKHLETWAVWMEKLAKEGKFVGAQPLKKAGKTITGNKKVTTDGPFIEGKEIVGGYLICKADTLDDAVEISKGCPILEFDDGVVEVREIGELKV